jgi:hypothetical protein
MSAAELLEWARFCTRLNWNFSGQVTAGHSRFSVVELDPEPLSELQVGIVEWEAFRVVESLKVGSGFEERTTTEAVSLLGSQNAGKKLQMVEAQRGLLPFLERTRCIRELRKLILNGRC